jgi:hypothetical protein
LTGTGAMQLSVLNVAPQSLTFGGPNLVRPGRLAPFDGTFTDLGSADRHTAVIDWGDGSVGAASIVASSNGWRISTGHV